MSWKSLVCAGLVCVVASPVLAAPTGISVTPLPYSAAQGAVLWEVRITTDTPANSLATELPMVLTPVTPAFTTFLNSGGDTTNGAATGTWYYNETAAGSGTLVWNTQQNAADTEQNLGNNPFTGTETEGLQIDTAMKRLFAALGSDKPLPDADGATAGTQVATLHIASSDGRWTWTDAIVAQNGVNTEFSGTTTSIIRGDMNGNRARNFLDVAPFGTALSNPGLYATQFPGLDRVARGDMNGNGALNFLDVAPFGACLSNPAGCPPNPGAGAGAGAVAASVGVPEPSTVALLGLGLLGVLGLFRRNK